MSDADNAAALALVRATSVPIHDIGTAIYLSKDVFEWAAEWGWSNPFAFYFAGRGGMLGEADADVVCSAFGWFEPNAVRAMFSEGAAVAGAREAARRMSEAHAKWGDKYFGAIEGIEGITALTEELVAGLEGSGIPLFVGWRDAAACDTPGGRAAQLMQILREWRGGLHLVATTGAGLTPLEAILSNEGHGQAKFFGWSEPFPEVTPIMKTKHDTAEALTDTLCAAGLARALDPERFPAFEAAVGTLRGATP
jgi:hypothetical protein